MAHNKDFERGVFFAIDFLVRWYGEGTLAEQLANDAGLGRKTLKRLWKDCGIEDADNEDRMLAFLESEFIKKEN